MEKIRGGRENTRRYSSDGENMRTCSVGGKIMGQTLQVEKI